MNNKTMQRIADKVLLQMEIEKLMNTEAGKLLDINPGYLSIIKKPDQYDKCPMKAWRKMHVWYHSGSNLRDYDWRKAPEVPDVHPEEEATETIPEVRRTATPKPEPPKEGSLRQRRSNQSRRRKARWLYPQPLRSRSMCFIRRNPRVSQAARRLKISPAYRHPPRKRLSVSSQRWGSRSRLL